MRCLVTAGPTYESLDKVRRLTNFSTGRLGTELAGFLTQRGHRVTLLRGEQSTWGGERRADSVETFSTTADLQERLERHSGEGIEALFHAAAVSDFTFGKIWEREESGALHPIRGGKLSTRQGTLLAELIPTPKVLAQLRGWYPDARLIGWKFEVDGSQSDVLEKAESQLRENRTNACVVNGQAYGDGFGLVTGSGQCHHQPDKERLFLSLALLVEGRF